MADTFPFYFPADARRLYSHESVLRRIAKVARWAENARILELFASHAGHVLARDIGAQVLALDSDAKVLEQLTAKAKSHGLLGRYATKVTSWERVDAPEGTFDGIILLGRVAMPLAAAAAQLRKYLAPKGRLALTYPVKVGRAPVGPSLDFWEGRLGEPLRIPRDAMMTLEAAGFEPESSETLADTDLDDYYRDLEAVVARLPKGREADVAKLKEEIDVHRNRGGRVHVSTALFVARRKEPGEKPPATRDRG